MISKDSSNQVIYESQGRTKYDSAELFSVVRAAIQHLHQFQEFRADVETSRGNINIGHCKGAILHKVPDFCLYFYVHEVLGREIIFVHVILNNCTSLEFAGCSMPDQV
jgi:hypothetical protein